MKGGTAMDTFGRSAWAQKSFSNNYLEKADIYIPERRNMISMFSSLLTFFYAGSCDIRVLDLGCGDGVLTGELLEKSNVSGKSSGISIVPTLADGSESMLQKAGERLNAYRNIAYVHASFHELIHGSTGSSSIAALGMFDLCVSSHAIHHLEMKDKTALFRFIFEHLNKDGRFINADVVLPPSEDLEAWYIAQWKESMQAMMDQAGLSDEAPDDVVNRYKDPSSMNRPDTLEDQVTALKEAGFREVDCYFKNGIFAVFGGKK
jgi:tRNA (cmo5U34)-methyltransferase